MATEKLTPGMFTPKAEAGQEIPFERCMRVYGQLFS
jgi:hypothetical protein